LPTLDFKGVRNEGEFVDYLNEGIALFRFRAGFTPSGDDEEFEEIANSWNDEKAE